jgi:methyl coenzyme M reductase subunit D
MFQNNQKIKTIEYLCNYIIPVFFYILIGKVFRLKSALIDINKFTRMHKLLFFLNLPRKPIIKSYENSIDCP